MVPVWRDGVIYLFCRGGFAAISLKPSPWGEGAPVRTLGRMRGLPLKAFPLGGRWHGEAVTDEGAGFGLGLLYAEGFALRGEFLSQRWERNQRIAGGRGRRALRAHRTAYPRSPITGGRVPVRFCKISGAQNLSGWCLSLPGHWALAFPKLLLVRFHFCAWLCRAGDSWFLAAGRSGTGPYNKNG